MLDQLIAGDFGFITIAEVADFNCTALQFFAAIDQGEAGTGLVGCFELLTETGILERILHLVTQCSELGGIAEGGVALICTANNGDEFRALHVCRHE